MGFHLNTLLEDALNKINDFTCGTHDDLGDDDADKQIDFWQKRANSLQRILRGWVQSTAPCMPNNVVVDVTSSTSVAVKVQESLTGAITTKFKSKFVLRPLRRVLKFIFYFNSSVVSFRGLREHHRRTWNQRPDQQSRGDVFDLSLIQFDSRPKILFPCIEWKSQRLEWASHFQSAQCHSIQ